MFAQSIHRNETHRLTSGDLQDLGRETNGALDMELLVLGPVDKIARDCIAIRRLLTNK